MMHYEEGLRYYKKAIEVGLPDHLQVIACQNSAINLLQIGNSNEAMEYLNVAQEIEPDNSSVQFLIGQISRSLSEQGEE